MSRIIFTIILSIVQSMLLAQTTSAESGKAGELFSSIHSGIDTVKSQTGRVVLVEEFSETGCSACAQYDSAFQATTDANANKVAVINYHCFYKLDPFYQYNKACDSRYSYYGLSGYPCAMMNGRQPTPSSAHQSMVTPGRINTLYNQPALFKIEIVATAGKPSPDTSHATTIRVTATALADHPSDSLRLFVAVTENNIDYEKRFGSKSVNGVNRFNHILRALLPGAGGTLIGALRKAQESQVTVNFTNDDKQINYDEVRIVVFIQDMVTKEVLGAAVMPNHPF